MPSVVLVLPKSGYRNDDFLAAAKHLGVDVIAASDVCHQLADIWEHAPVALRFRDAQAAADELARGVRERRPLAVVGVDDLTALASRRRRSMPAPGSAWVPPSSASSAPDRGWRPRCRG